MPSNPPQTSASKFPLSFSLFLFSTNSVSTNFLKSPISFFSSTQATRMKKSGLFAASVAAASATAVSVSSSTQNSNQDGKAERRGRDESSSSSSTEKFAPRFDGLRFIETLITAHR